MIAIDTNVLLHAHREDSPHHHRALAAFEAATASSWALPWPCVHEFIAIATHPRIYDPPTPAVVALDAVRAWLESPSLTMLAETRGYFERLGAVLASSLVAGPRVHDARIAALCLHHGVTELLTSDRDFGRFPDLKTRNPLV